MSLFDVDKTSQDRGSPDPNRPDQLIEGSRKNHGTISSSYHTSANTSPNLRMVLKNNMIITYDNANNINSVYGYITGVSTTTPVLIIAQAGYDVFTDILGISRPDGL